MKKLGVLLFVFGFKLTAFSQVNTLKSKEDLKPKVENPKVKSINQTEPNLKHSESRSKVVLKRKIKELPKKENHEFTPKKD